MENTWVTRKKWGEPPFILEMHDSHLGHLSVERKNLADKNIRWLKKETDQFLKLVSYHKNYVYPTHPNVDSQACLYLDGFHSRDDEQQCKRFHAATVEEKFALVPQLKNNRIKIFAERILLRNFYGNTNTRHKISLDLNDFKGGQKLKPQQALRDIAELKKTTLTDKQHKLLLEYEKYLLDHFLQHELDLELS